MNLICCTQIRSRSIGVRSHECHGVSNHRPRDCFYTILFILATTKTSKLVTNTLWPIYCPKRASKTEVVSMSWRHHEDLCHQLFLSLQTREKSNSMRELAGIPDPVTNKPQANSIISTGLMQLTKICHAIDVVFSKARHWLFAMYIHTSWNVSKIKDII